MKRLVPALALVALQAQAAGTLTVCTDDAPEGFDIVQYQLSATYDAAGLPIYDTLVRFEPGGTQVVPGLAERWDVSADGMQYTFTLRSGVKFHTTPWFTPTRPLNADDVVGSFERLLDPRHPAHGAARNGYVYWTGLEMDKLVQRVEKLDARTVRFTLTRPDVAFLSDLAIANIGAIYPAEYVQQLARSGRLDQLNTQPVGSGPFVFRSYAKDATVRYAAFAEHWNGRPAVDQLVLAVTVDPDVRVQRVKAGECLVAVRAKPQTLAGLRSQPQLTLVPTTPLATNYLALNVRRKPLDDVRLRRALWLAVDKRTYIQAVESGQGTPAVSFLPPAMWSHDATLKDRADVKQARALVQASGYDGRELVLFLAIGGNRKLAGELLQADWAKIGVKVTVRMLELGEMYKRAGAGEHDIVLLSWYSDNGDPDNFLTPNLSCAADRSGGNKAHWCEPRMDALLQAAAATRDVARRSALYVQAQQLVYDQVPVIPLEHATETAVLNRRVSGFVPSPFLVHDFRRTRVD